MTPTKEKATKLRRGFSATVRTTEQVIVATVGGNVAKPAEVFIHPGGELPDNLLDGEYERLDKLGAFTPVPPLAERGLVETVPAHVLSNTAPPGEAVATPSDIRVPTEEEADAQARLAQAQEDVRRAFAQVEADASTPNDNEPGTPGNPVAHVPIAEAEEHVDPALDATPVVPPPTPEPVTPTPAKQTAKRASKSTAKRAGSARKRS